MVVISLYEILPKSCGSDVPGNFLFSTGPNTQGGGNRTTRGHYDVPMRECSIKLDGKLVIENGRIIDPKMIVAKELR